MQDAQQWVACQVTAYSQFGHFPFLVPPLESFFSSFFRCSRSCSHSRVFSTEGPRHSRDQGRFLLTMVAFFSAEMWQYHAHSSVRVREHPLHFHIPGYPEPRASAWAFARFVAYEPSQISSRFSRTWTRSHGSMWSQTLIDSVVFFFFLFFFFFFVLLAGKLPPTSSSPSSSSSSGRKTPADLDLCFVLELFPLLLSCSVLAAHRLVTS
jgi:hypothetical protein